MKNIEPETLVALGLVLLKQLQPYVQELSDSKHQANYQRNFAALENPGQDPYELQDGRAIDGLGGKNITLKQKEDDNKLSFMRKGQNQALSSEENTDRIGAATRGQTMGMMSGMTGSMGTTGPSAHDSAMSRHHGMR